MSYISLPRLVFSGQFQADVSTVNNDVRHYDITRFKPQYQQGTERLADNHRIANGWWNPSGTGAFRLIDVRVVQALAAPGSGEDDPAAGLYLSSQINRPAAKLVDLDPQFQMGSMIFGMRVALTDGETEYMRGNVRPTAFRDIYFGRSPAGGSGGASAKFTTVLTDVEWTDAAEQSPVLMLLKGAAEENDNTLSINFMTYGFVTTSPFEGLVAGAIGVWEATDPKSFVAGRRFAALGPRGTERRRGLGFSTLMRASMCRSI